MALNRYNVGVARRFVAGNVWCATKKNQGKLPCLCCLGRGTVNDGSKWGRMACPDCKATGYCDKTLWKIWYKLWVYTQATGKELHETLFHG